MQIKDEPCHGVLECLQVGSEHWAMSAMVKPWQKLHSYIVWHIENLGWVIGLRDLCHGGHCRKDSGARLSERRDALANQEVLGLRTGEWVEVRPIADILATLDGNRRHRGLRWMTGMRKFCGQRFRVYKPVDRIMLETNGELRRMKNTVLLEGAMCDGAEFGHCDRSCFHFWREVWLRRVPAESANGDKH